jgi:uncharacterized protein YdaU (DUF1376 family)
VPTSQSSRSPAFQYYPKDFLADANVIPMTLTEVGAYWKLVSICWLQGSLPSGHAALARLLGIGTTAFTRLWPALEPCFRLNNDRLVHPRLEHERREQVKRRRASAKNGRLGGRPRNLVGSFGLPKQEPRKSSPSASASASASASTDTDSSATRAEPSVLDFPVIGRPGQPTWGLTLTLVDEWTAAYPGLDVLAECRRALAWVRANRPKTARGMPAFLVRWLNQAVDRPRGVPSGGQPRRRAAEPLPTSAEPWECRHEPRCPTRGHCANAVILGRPEVAL